jgi:hypothetical protein
MADIYLVTLNITTKDGVILVSEVLSAHKSVTNAKEAIRDIMYREARGTKLVQTSNRTMESPTGDKFRYKVECRVLQE